MILIVIILVTFVITLICFPIFCYIYNSPLEFSYDDRPSILILYVKAILMGLSRKQGQFNNKEDKSEKPRNKITAIDCRIDKNNLTQYAIVCGYGDEPLSVPPCYLELYFMPLIVCAVTSDNFQLSPLGLIHVGQTVTQHMVLQHLLREPFDLECSVAEYRPCDKGIYVDLAMKVYDRREMCVWEGVATLLSRNSATQRSGARKNTQGLGPDESEGAKKGDTLIMRLAKDLGVRYARVSGDWNPHHLWAWSARLLGYHKPIAHGMWTMARGLTWIERAGKFPVQAPYSVAVQFKRPVFLPGTVAFRSVPQPDKDKYCFKVTDDDTGALQMVGEVTRSL